MLRKPLHQPVGSEKDAYDAMAHHQMVVDEAGKIVAIGRLYINADNEAAIRFLAVDPTLQDKGLGTLVAMTLESVARQEGVKRVVCSAREDAVDFFAKLGFVNQGDHCAADHPDPPLLMIKTGSDAGRYPASPLTGAGQLQQAWYEHIPLSEKDGRAHQPIHRPALRHHHARDRQPESAPHAVRRQPVLAGDADRLGADLLKLLLRAPPRRHHHSAEVAQRKRLAIRDTRLVTV